MGAARVWLVVMDPPRELQKDFEVKLKDLKDKSQDGTQVSDLPEMDQQGWGARSGVHLGGGARHRPLCPQSQEGPEHCVLNLTLWGEANGSAWVVSDLGWSKLS